MSQKPEGMEAVIEPLKSEVFSFSCYPGIACFTRCCQDLNLLLTPYDIVRMVQRLELSSEEFIDRFTVQERDPLFSYPRLKLRMREEDGRCPFVSAAGCTIYEDRPGSCRLYPIGRAARCRPGGKGEVEENYFTVREDHCLGFLEQQNWTLSAWVDNQGVADYNRINDAWMSIITRKPLYSSVQELEKKLKMFYLASYQLDEFSDFVFSSGLLKRIELEPERLSRMKEDLVELHHFSIQWLKFSLFGELTLNLRK